MSQRRRAIEETRERLSEEELERLEQLAHRAIRDKRFAKEFATRPVAVFEEHGLSLATVEGAVIEVVDPELGDPPEAVFCFMLFYDSGTGEFCGLCFWD